MTRLQSKWYRRLAAEGFHDIEGGTDSSIVFRHTKGSPEKHVASGRRETLDEDARPLKHTEPRVAPADYTARYYRDAQTLASNWYPLWVQTARDCLEFQLWQWHATEGLGPGELLERLKSEYKSILRRGVFASADSVQRVLFKWSAVLACIDFDDPRLDDWAPGQAVVVALRVIPGLRLKVNGLLKRAWRHRYEVHQRV